MISTHGFPTVRWQLDVTKMVETLLKTASLCLHLAVTSQQYAPLLLPGKYYPGGQRNHSSPTLARINPGVLSILFSSWLSRYTMLDIISKTKAKWITREGTVIALNNVCQALVYGSFMKFPRFYQGTVTAQSVPPDALSLTFQGSRSLSQLI